MLGNNVQNNNIKMSPGRISSLKVAALLMSALVVDGFSTMHLLGNQQQQKQVTSVNLSLLRSATEPPTATTTMSGRKEGTAAGSPLSMLIDEQCEFEINVGRALDNLRDDYPRILIEQPNFSIYDRDIEVVDPSGVKLHGLKNYKNAFRLLHAIVGIFYCPERSGISFRMCFDKARNNIRVHWNAEVIPKAIFGGTHSTLHVDGISVYEISRASGNITQHRVEHLLINDLPIRPKQGIFESLRRTAVDKDCIPVFNTGSSASSPNRIVDFQMALLPHGKPSTSLFAMSSASSGGNDEYPGLDWDALERKNASRKKFGLNPLSPEEFLDLEAAVQQMEVQQRQRAAASAAELAKKKKNEGVGMFRKMLGTVLEDTCETNFDCERPQVCCDFGFKKMCCTSGNLVFNGPNNNNKQGDLALVPVPVGMPREPGNF